MAAEYVSESRNLDSEDAWKTLRSARYLPLLRRSVSRMRDADGFAFARAIGLQIVLATLPALIFFVAAAVWTGSSTLQSSMEGIVTTLTPGPTSDVLQQAVDQGEDNARRNVLAMVLGGVTALNSGAVAMSQIQQAGSRLYGIEEDRSLTATYRMSLLLSLSVGLLLAGAFVALAFGSTIADAVEGESVWLWLRWPLAVLAAVVALAALYKVAPNRTQPRLSWLMVGGLTATALLVVFSAGLALFLSLSSTFGTTYGPLAGLIGLLIWAQLAGVALLAGLAFAAQLEAEGAETAGVGPVGAELIG
jgi:YihY family inner membrane protein